MPPTRERVLELLSYDPDMGLFLWLNPKGRHAGPNAGNHAGGLDTVTGYQKIGIDGRPWLAHRLAWLIVYGEWPQGQIDHANGNRGDNRLANLRLATQTQNNGNTSRRSDNKSGYKGVAHFPYDGRKKSWRAYININKKLRTIGYFLTAEDAARAYDLKATEVFGEFARLNFPREVA